MIIRKVFLSVFCVSALLAAGCASTDGKLEESNSAIVSVTTIGGSSDSRPPRVQGNYSSNNNPLPRDANGQRIGTMSTMEKLRRSRQ